MTYRGVVENGVIRILDGKIPEGTDVRVEIEVTQRAKTLGDILDRGPYFVEGYPGELDDLLRVVMQEREESIQVETEREERRGSL